MEEKQMPLHEVPTYKRLTKLKQERFDANVNLYKDIRREIIAKAFGSAERNFGRIFLAETREMIRLKIEEEKRRAAAKAAAEKQNKGKKKVNMFHTASSKNKREAPVSKGKPATVSSQKKPV
jgi:hypothetical protein